MVGSSQDQGGPLPLQHIYTRRNPTPPVAKASSFFSGLTLSTLPTSPDCMPFVSTRSVEDRTTDIPFCRLGDLECTSLSFSNEDHGPLSPAHNNAVFHNGLFYCLGMDGALGVYMIITRKRGVRFWAHMKTNLHSKWTNAISSNGRRSCCLFLGRYSSILTSASNEDIKNSICLPKFTEEDDYKPVTIDPWDQDNDELCFYESPGCTLHPCWVMVPKAFQDLTNKPSPYMKLLLLVLCSFVQ